MHTQVGLTHNLGRIADDERMLCVDNRSAWSLGSVRISFAVPYLLWRNSADLDGVPGGCGL
jgi:hypothetical protein